MFPTVGRIVHYYDESGRGPMAAIIADTCDNVDVSEKTHGHKHTCDERCVHVTLAILIPERFETRFQSTVPFISAPPTLSRLPPWGVWCWPPREA